MSKPDRQAVAAAETSASAESEIANMMKSQAGSVTQDDIPPHFPVFATMEAAWQELSVQFIGGLTKKQQQDAKFIFFHGIQAAANLMIYCAGQGKFEAAADQITADCLAYEKEAEAVLRERAEMSPTGAGEDAPIEPTSH